MVNNIIWFCLGFVLGIFFFIILCVGLSNRSEHDDYLTEKFFHDELKHMTNEEKEKLKKEYEDNEKN